MFYDIIVVQRKKTNGLLNFQPFLVSSFGVLVIDNQKSKTIDLYSAYTEKFYRRSFNRSQLSSAMGYRVGTCATLFIMNWGIHQGKVFDLNTPMLSSKKTKLKNSDDYILPQHKQTHVTHICSMVQERNKDIPTFHEEENPLVQSVY